MHQQGLRHQTQFQLALAKLIQEAVRSLSVPRGSFVALHALGKLSQPRIRQLLQGLLSLHAASRFGLPFRELDEPRAPEGRQHGVCSAARQQATTIEPFRAQGSGLTGSRSLGVPSANLSRFAPQPVPFEQKWHHY